MIEIFDDIFLHCADIGARSGLSEHWKSYKKNLKVDAFEPDQSAFDGGARTINNITWLPFGLASKTGKHKFYLLKGRSGSSLYPVNEEILKNYTARSYWELEKIIEIDFYSFSDCINKFNREVPELIKLDTQGSELDILQSLGNEHWDNILCIETEIEFEELYKNQPLFSDIDQFLRSKGFTLFDIRTHRSYLMEDNKRNYYLRKYLSFETGRHDLSAKLLAGDALYIRIDNKYLFRTKETTLKYVLIFLIYHYYDYAIRLILNARERSVITSSEFEYILSFIKSKSPKPRFYQRSSGLLRKLIVLLTHLDNTLRRKIGLKRHKFERIGWSLRKWPNL